MNRCVCLFFDYTQYKITYGHETAGYATGVIDHRRVSTTAQVILRSKKRRAGCRVNPVRYLAADIRRDDDISLDSAGSAPAPQNSPLARDDDQAVETEVAIECQHSGNDKDSTAAAR